MAQEIEAKILNIDTVALEQKLVSIGARKEGEVFFRSTNFDFPGLVLDKNMAWVRLRTDGLKTTLAYKKRLGVKGNGAGLNDAGMEEIEVEVDSFEQTALLLKSIGLVEKFSQEKKRTTWKKGDVIFDIDTWPRIKPYLEVEAPTWEAVDAALHELGFDPADKKICSATQIFALSGINDKDYIKMTFDEFVKRPV